MKRFNYILIILFSLTLTFQGCQEDDYQFGDIKAPANIQLKAWITGADAANPYGDGSGEVVIAARAENATSYKFIYDGSEFVSTSGRQTFTFSTLGVNTYRITVVVSGAAGITSSESMEVEVLASYAPPADLLAKLTNGSSRTFRIKAEGNKHFGLGPVGGGTPCEWYGAGPNEKDGLGMYDDRFTFNADGTFTHVTNGTIFGRDPHMPNDLGATTIAPNGADIENYPFDDYTASWSLTAPGGVETINLTGTAFMGYYTGGNHQYKIFDRGVADEFTIRTTDAAGEFDWWFIIIAE